MTIKDSTGKEIASIVVLKNYFGLQPGQTAQGFVHELRDLTPKNKEELARDAAKELGYTVTE